MWGSVKAVLRDKFIALNAYVRKEKMFPHLEKEKKKTEKEEQIKPK